MRKVNLIAQNLSRLCIRPQRIQRTADHRARLFLVIEDRQHRRGHHGGEDGHAVEPAVGVRDGGEGAVGAAFH